MVLPAAEVLLGTDMCETTLNKELSGHYYNSASTREGC